KVSAMARGARKSQKRFGGALGLFVLGEATLRERRGAELMLLESFQARRDHSRLGVDPVRLGHASYGTELVRELTPPPPPAPAAAPARRGAPRAPPRLLRRRRGPRAARRHLARLRAQAPRRARARPVARALRRLRRRLGGGARRRHSGRRARRAPLRALRGVG